MLVCFIGALISAGCGEKTPVNAPVTLEAVQQPITDTEAQEAQARLYEAWIARMDPYVTQNADGTYMFNEAAFADMYGRLADSDRIVVTGLQKCIPVVNAKVKESVPSGGAAKIWFQWYWWGYKECYSQLSAEYMLDLAQVSVYGYPAYVWAKYYYYHYGQFCIYHTWVGGMWISAS